MDIKIVDTLEYNLYQEMHTIAESDINWAELSEKTILITGAAGFISYYMILAILDHNDNYGTGIKIVALVRNEKKAKEKYGNILERSDITLLVQDICLPIQYTGDIHYIVHAASQASNIQFETDPVGTIQANLLGTTNVLELSRVKNPESILFLSSLKIYGKIINQGKSISEQEQGELNCISYKNCYAIGKRAGETLCACYAKQYNLPVKIVRPAYIYGASSLNDDRVWAQFIANVVRKEDILLKSDGMLRRSFCYVTDAAIAVLTVLLKGAAMKPYNISSEGSNIRIRDFAQKAVEAFPERNLHLKFQNSEDENKPEKNMAEILDNTELVKLGWKAKVSLIDGIRKSVNILENYSFVREI